VADAALLLDVMAGNQPGDLYTPAPPPAGQSFASYAAREPGRLRIGRTLRHPVGDGAVHPDCVAAWEDASQLLASLGHEVEDVEPPFGPEAVPAFETLWYAMATLAPVDPAREDRLLPLTTYLRERGQQMSAGQLVQAQAVLQFLVRAALATLDTYDAVLMPTLAEPPAPVGYFEEVPPPENFERQKRFTPYTAVFNVSGQPAVSLPLYWTDSGLPIGVMLAGRMGEESTLLSLSAQLESARPWRDRHPPLW
jgi:amidase